MNRYHVTKNHTLGLMFLALLTVQGSFLMSSQEPSWFRDTLMGAILPASVVRETNELRKVAHVGMLTESDVLTKSAQLKAEDMAREKYFAHTSPAGVTPWEWFKKADYAYLYAGENLAVHYDESAAVVRAWMDSRTHRETMLGKNYTEIGIGVAEGYFEGRTTTFVVEHFGTRLPTNTNVNAPKVYSGTKDATLHASALAMPVADDATGLLAFMLFGLVAFGALFFSFRAFVHAWKHEHAYGLTYAAFLFVFIGGVYIQTLF